MILYINTDDNDDDFGWYEKMITIYKIENNIPIKLGRIGSDHDKIKEKVKEFAEENNIEVTKINFL